PLLPPALATVAAGRPTSGLAIASLVLGVLGFCSGGLTALVGLVLGIVALSKISRSQGQLGGKGLAIAAISISGVFVLLLPALLLPALIKARQKAQETECVKHVKQVALAVRLFAEDNNGRYPTGASWCDAIATNLANAKLLQCPARPGLRCGYGFNRQLAGRTLSSVPPDVVMLFETSGGWNVTGGERELLQDSPHGRSYVVGFADGSVRQLKEDELSTLRWGP